MQLFFNDGDEYEECHGGIVMKSRKKTILVFLDKAVYKKSVWWYVDREFDKEAFILNALRVIDNEEQVMLLKNSFWMGTYTKERNNLAVMFTFNQNTCYEEYITLGPDILLDEQLREYKLEIVV